MVSAVVKVFEMITTMVSSGSRPWRLSKNRSIERLVAELAVGWCVGAKDCGSGYTPGSSSVSTVLQTYYKPSEGAWICMIAAWSNMAA
jgi:hypothetical protein